MVVNWGAPYRWYEMKGFCKFVCADNLVSNWTVLTIRSCVCVYRCCRPFAVYTVYFLYSIDDIHDLFYFLKISSYTYTPFLFFIICTVDEQYGYLQPAFGVCSEEFECSSAFVYRLVVPSFRSLLFWTCGKIKNISSTLVIISVRYKLASCSNNISGAIYTRIFDITTNVNTG